MKKNILTFLFAVFMMTVCFSVNTEAAETEEIPVLEQMTAFSDVSAFAAAAQVEEIEIVDAGYCGDPDVMWGITPEGILLIVSETKGTMWDMTSDETPWDIYEEYIRAVVVQGTVKNIPARLFYDYWALEYVYIEEGVTQIGDEAFGACGNLVEVELPNSITSFGENVFSNCESLSVVNIPTKLKAIPDATFYNCYKLKRIVIPNGITQIGESVFGCCALETITIPNSVTKIGVRAFVGCENLKTITLSNGLLKIDAYAFEGCTNLTSLKIPGTVTFIGQYAFSKCSALTSMSIPGSVKKIETNAFLSCEKLRTVSFGNGVTSVGGTIFKDCTALEKVTFSNSVTYIGSYAFLNCKNLKEVVLPEYITELPNNMFEKCASLKTVVIPSQVTKIGDRVFYNCAGLTTIRIPVGVTEIGEKAFQGCSKLNKVSVMNPNVLLDWDVFKYDDNILIRCHENSTAHTYAERHNYAYEFLDMSKVTDYFADVAEGKWFVNSVQYVFDKELMSGSGEYFNPTKNVTRAQLVTTIYRLAGSPEVTDYSACQEFSDVEVGKYYTNAICWAYNEGIATGNDGKFNTTGNLTRQQMAAFFFRYAEVMGYDTTDRTDFLYMLNADKVSEYAVEAMEWAVGSGMISGSETKDDAGNVVYDLNPRGNTTRAQLSAILQRFCEGVANTEKPDTDDELPGVPLV